MRSTPTRLLLLALSSGLSLSAWGQSGQSSFVQQARDQAVQVYEQRLAQQRHVYEGHQYVGHDPRIKIHPYYPTDTLQRGSVRLDGVQYQDVRLLYDVVRDQVVIQPPEGAYRYNLPVAKITAFTLGDRQFDRLAADSTTGLRQTGFYEIIYNGGIRVLARRVKTIKEDLSGNTYKGTYQIKDQYLVQKDKVFYAVKSKRALLKLFPDQAKELRRYMRQNELRFTDGGRDEAMARTAQRYDELKRGL